MVKNRGRIRVELKFFNALNNLGFELLIKDRKREQLLNFEDFFMFFSSTRYCDNIIVPQHNNAMSNPLESYIKE